ncbi:M56 family metallopeptidase [Rhodococcus ruber]|uniref:Peptidase M48 domain-containing protein n=1 Tax=Rhodococcus ruber TaxID=1830 RepID=A0A098BP69_9NOCA|nr:M56 family metallopeptidase [Rhodococcus ruber]MCD2127230.1 M56 family metallopeptidase [Rhodococcus ruber]MCZ4503173.1 M56 family metallopeptidase [Rhodococcus ruber]MCZ4530732.1 M56 family metallopeptidase [Rhodococcus ruber]MCZ4621568.1 M56 family metallopeptidase [Rhodococcus ruber]MDI9969452.1 M56 family metallopeptidase [Rhodococcus ruber]
MSITVCLLLYSGVVAVLGPPVLSRLTQGGIAPRLGVTAWLAAIGGVVCAWAIAVVVLLVDLGRAWNRPAGWVIDCFAGLRDLVSGRAGLALQTALLMLSVLGVAAFSIAAWQTGRGVLRMRARTHAHARMARIIGHRVPGIDAVIVEAPERVAYCVTGRPSAIVVTSAALDALDEHQLGAVLAHERAHLTGRHPQLLALIRGLAAALPRMTLFRLGATEIARLLEMCADDAAARTHGSATLLGGLLALSGAHPVPSGTLGATSVDVLTRAGRLTSHPRPLHHLRVSALLTASTALIALGPVIAGLLAAAGMVMCGPMGI